MFVMRKFLMSLALALAITITVGSLAATVFVTTSYSAPKDDSNR
jgi:hypothetical protein